jgi:hypothetical protein
MHDRKKYLLFPKKNSHVKLVILRCINLMICYYRLLEKETVLKKL